MICLSITFFDNDQKHSGIRQFIYIQNPNGSMAGEMDIDMENGKFSSQSIRCHPLHTNTLENA